MPLEQNGIHIKPIGYFKTLEDEKYAVSRQPPLMKGNRGQIVLNSHSNFEEALKDLDGFDHIFVIYQFHRNSSWKPKVMPPRGDKKRGVFATRSPHRPNFLGLSCLKLKKIEGLTLHVENHDLLDGTPIFDIKPYLTYADSYPEAKQGWLETLKEESSFKIIWDKKAEEKLQFLNRHFKIPIALNINPRLHLYPFPKKQNRIRLLPLNLYEISYKTWRLNYSVDEMSKEVTLLDLYSGYDLETLEGIKECLYGDLDQHIEFIKFFK